MQKGNAVAAFILGVEGVKRSDYYAPNPFDGWAAQHPTKALHATLAVVIGGYEEATNKDTWRNPGQDDAAYFTRLASWGYTLSEVEQIVLDTAAKADDEHEPFPGDEDDFDGYNSEDEDPDAA